MSSVSREGGGGGDQLTRPLAETDIDIIAMEGRIQGLSSVNQDVHPRIGLMLDVPDGCQP